MSAQLAPNFTLDHVSTGHQVSLSDFRGQTVVVLFAGKDSSEQARQIGRTIGNRYAPGQLPIITVLDMRGVPRLVKGLAKGSVEKAYNEAVQDFSNDLQAKGQPVPGNPAQYIVMLPDWQGSVADSYSLQGVDRQAVAVLVDGNGYIRGYGAGAQGGDQILSLFG
jgi:hypothetical protein